MTKLVEMFTSTISGNSIVLSMNGDGRAAVSSPLAMLLAECTGHWAPQLPAIFLARDTQRLVGPM